MLNRNKMGRGQLLSLWLLLMGTFLLTPRWVEAASCPNVGILLDRSASMNLAPDGTAATAQNPSRWKIAVDAVTNIVTTNDGKFPMGFVLFPSAGSMMCDTRTGFDVPIGYGKRTAILSAMSATLPGGNTPTSGAVRGAVADAALSMPNREQYLILITDGNPCCAVGCQDTVLQLFEAVKAIEEARARNPSVRTFVVGFGALNPTFTDALNQMADAGGVPAMAAGAIRFYQADSATSLNAALDAIIKVVIKGSGDIGGGVTVCDDSCYVAGCPTGQLCSGGACQVNPCSTISCGLGEYCYTDGVSGTGACTSACWQSCPSGQRCILGTCQQSACADACPIATQCDAASGSCRPDPACSGVLCKVGQGCKGGRCVDDVCSYISCPKDTRCVPLEGTCLALPGAVPPGVDTVGSGCSCNLGAHGPGSSYSAVWGLSVLALAGLFRARSRRRRLSA